METIIEAPGRKNGTNHRPIDQVEKKEKRIFVPRLIFEEMQVTVEGTAPIMINKFSNKAITQMAEAQLRSHKLSKKEKEAERKPKVPSEEFEQACHRIPEYPGALGVTALSFKHAMIAMVRFCPDLKMTQIKVAFRVIGDLLPILSADTLKPIKVTYEKHCSVNAVRVGAFGSETTDLRYRPCIREPWAVKLSIRYSPGIVDPQSLLNLLAMAGELNGVGEWRPGGKESTGQFGTFKIHGETDK